MREISRYIKDKMCFLIQELYEQEIQEIEQVLRGRLLIDKFFGYVVEIFLGFQIFRFGEKNENRFGNDEYN